MRVSSSYKSAWLAVLLLVTTTTAQLLVTTTTAQEEADPVYSALRDGHSNCNVYLAPSPSIGGWGVYAARDFEEDEVVDLAPRYIPLKTDSMKKNVLDDFFYGFSFNLDPSDTTFGAVVFGMTMFYNHGSGEKQNVIYTNVGREPDKDMPWGSDVIAFVANRDIVRGEELLSSYGDDHFFTDRGLVMNEYAEGATPPSAETLDLLEAKYCSKIVAGVGHSTWLQRVLPAQEHTGDPPPNFDHDEHLPLQDHANAIAKEFIPEGSLLEMAPALVVPAEEVWDSPLAPMAIFWNDLTEKQQDTIKLLREAGSFRMKGVDKETGDPITDVLEDFDDAAILPAAGNIGLVQKVGPEALNDANCRMQFIAAAEDSESMDVGSADLVLQLFATRDIIAGEQLRLNLPDGSSWDAKMILQQMLALQGQPIPEHIVNPYNPSVVPGFDEEEGGDEL